MANLNRNDVTPSSNNANGRSAEKTDRPANETLIDQTEAQSATEAARVGLEDQSAEMGAVVEGDHMAAGRPTTANDPDVMQEQAKVVGEEAIGGTTPTPDQSDVDTIAGAVGVNTKPEHPVKVVEEMRKRDEKRHELDPESKGPAASA